MTEKKKKKKNNEGRNIGSSMGNNKVTAPSQNSYSLVTIIIVSVGASVFCQLVVPGLWKSLPHACTSLHLPEYLCQRNQPKRFALQRASSNKVGFLEEPFPVQPWKDVGNELARPVTIPDQPVDISRVDEALAITKAAKKFLQVGNVKTALKVMEHAMELAPNVPDVLCGMGKAKELSNDMIAADECYTKALVYDPQHTEASSRRAKTAPLVRTIDKKSLKAVHDLRDEFSSLQHTTALRHEMRETYFLYVYHTVAIEGNTMSLGQTRAVLESGMAIPGKSIREHNEILGMDAALRFLNLTLLGKNHDYISYEDVMELHHRVLGHVDPMEAGRLRRSQVYVGRFTPVPPEEVKEHMDQFIDWLNDEETMKLDPIERAAIAHYKLVLVHPFSDGNGRTARLLLNLILMQSGFPPVILRVETRAEYYATLHVANLGDLRPFIRYVTTGVKESLQRYISSVTTRMESKSIGEADTQPSSTITP